MKRLLCVVLLLLLLVVPPAVAAPVVAPDAPMAVSIFINEIHYDNDLGDSGEAVEIAGPAGTDLTGWKIIRYNGNGGAVYTTPAANPSGSDTLNGIIPNNCGGYGVMVVQYLADGLQNGAPDGIALVTNTNTVVQFLSYEGSFIAVGGAASGMTSVDIGVSETGTTPVGQSLQLKGAGTYYEDFAWSTASTSSFGACNAGQAFQSPGDTAPTVSSTSPLNGATNVAVSSDIAASFSEAVNVSTSSFTISCVSSGTHTFALAGSGAGPYTLNPDNDFAANEQCTVTAVRSQITDQDGAADPMAADYVWTFTTDTPPVVSSTTPAKDATGVAVNATITLNFNEIVDASASAFTVECPVSTLVTFSANPTLPAYDTSSIVLTPSANLPNGTICTVTALAAEITDNDGTVDQLDGDKNGTGGDNYSFNFTTVAANPCNDPFTPIYTIQGSGTSSPLVGTTVDIEGVVVGDFQGAAGHYGFYVQDPTGDANAATSDGVFVYVPDANPFAGVAVQVGDALHLKGTIKEFNGLTEIDTLTSLNKCDTGISVAATTIDLPEAVNGDLEKYEGMLVSFPETLTVSQNYFQGRYGQVTLSSDGRMYNPTNGQGDTATLNARRILVLDDGYSGQNPNPIPYIGADNTLRAGDTTDGLTGTLDYGLITSDSTTRDYRLQPTQAVSFTRVNARTAAPASVGGNIKVASFNVLNYFTSWGCGDACRGANDATEFDRQRTKIIKALAAINADVVGLMEIENNGATAVGDLVAGLNAEIGGTPYAYVVEPAPGTDGIKVAMIYKPGTVSPDGLAQNYQVTTDPVYNPLFDRPPLAQTFTALSTGERFTVIVNHFKSKGSCPTSGVDVDYGQGCWNAKRTAQATGLLAFITALKASTLDEDVLVIGDLNAYGAEDPINTLVTGGLINEVGKISASTRYSYIFDGQSGYLDQGLATPNLDTQVSGRTIWHINADEPSVIDYNTEFKGAPTYPPDLYSATPYRSSDHDPVIIGLNLQPDHSSLAGYADAWHGNSGLRFGATWSAATAPVGGGSNDGVVTTPGVAWSVAAGGSVDVTVNGAAGYVTGWIDWDQDNAFWGSGEQVFANEAFTAGQKRTIGFAIPDGTTFGTTYNARFRVYPTAQTLPTLSAAAAPDEDLSPSDGAIGGEVEDYTWTFGPNAITLRHLAAAGVPATGWPAAAGLGALGIVLLAWRRRK